ncbi:uncharacterized protein LOC129000000 isoform X1 [Macrosteles quadrilineatus]|uniref:uncharacterized protein LOC129000000 isoform X1 n=1 Tax=Macrosteles quadrilineatus TaxID=74068 RepID=UPI0023E0A553|nr:uncharacterized protein LOC129000000 isoform X1 [Macrosteles quadrilineatus]
MSGRVSRTKPNCARCRNHGIQVPIKDHKLFCKWKKCICDKCSRTAERQQIMAKQTRIRRAEEVVSNLAKKGLPVPERVLTPPPESPLNVDDSLDSNYSACASPATGSAPPSPPRQQPRLTPPPRPFHDATDLWKSIVKLIETCHLPLNISPLLYIIFTEITPNPDEVIKRIKAATEMLHSIPRLLEMCMMPDSTIPLLIIILTEVTPNADAVFLRMKMALEALKKENPTTGFSPEGCRQSLTLDVARSSLLAAGSQPVYPPHVSTILHDHNRTIFPVCPCFPGNLASPHFPVQEPSARSPGIPPEHFIGPPSPNSEDSNQSGQSTSSLPPEK